MLEAEIELNESLTPDVRDVLRGLLTQLVESGTLPPPTCAAIARARSRLASFLDSLEISLV